jgi:hypothetical protein
MDEMAPKAGFLWCAVTSPRKYVLFLVLTSGCSESALNPAHAEPYVLRAGKHAGRMRQVLYPFLWRG